MGADDIEKAARHGRAAGELYVSLQAAERWRDMATRLATLLSQARLGVQRGTWPDRSDAALSDFDALVEREKP